MKETKYMPISCAIIYFIIFAPVFFRFILKENEKSVRYTEFLLLVC